MLITFLYHASCLLHFYTMLHAYYIFIPCFMLITFLYHASCLLHFYTMLHAYYIFIPCFMLITFLYHASCLLHFYTMLHAYYIFIPCFMLITFLYHASCLLHFFVCAASILEEHTKSVRDTPDMFSPTTCAGKIRVRHQTLKKTPNIKNTYSPRY